MTDRRALANHLRLFADLGIDGISRDPSWRQRTSAPAGGGDVALPERAAVGATTETDTHPDAASALVALREDIGDCVRCALHTQGRRQIVFGVGNPNADLMFVGEAPGADEDVQGEPFVGQAGQLLTKIIVAMGLTRDDVYIANVIKCRPPGNRNPEPVEVATCEPFLFRQIAIVKPKVVVALGTFAAQTLLKTTTPISKLRGQVHDFRDGAKLIPTFHPAYLIRNRNNQDLKRSVWEDMKKALALLGRTD